VHVFWVGWSKMWNIVYVCAFVGSPCCKQHSRRKDVVLGNRVKPRGPMGTQLIPIGYHRKKQWWAFRNCDAHGGGQLHFHKGCWLFTPGKVLSKYTKQNQCRFWQLQRRTGRQWSLLASLSCTDPNLVYLHLPCLLLLYYHLYTNMLLNCSGQCWFLQRWEMGADNLVWANIALVLLHPVLQLCPAAPYWVMNIAMWRVPHGGAVGWSCRTYWSLNIDPLGPVDDQVWKSN
jgi:hypothetical protein